MHYRFIVENFGKIDTIQLELSSLTVFAGTNSTGKSYASRALYCILNAMNADPTLKYFQRIQVAIEDILSTLWRELPDEFEKRIFSSSGKTSHIIDLIQEKKDAKLFKVPFHDVLSEIEQYVSLLEDSIEEDIAAVLEGCKQQIDANEASILREGYRISLHNNFIHNFQVRSLKDLIGTDKSKAATLRMITEDGKSTIIHIRLTSEGKIEYENADFETIRRHLEVFSRVVYLESPIYWKLEDALKNAGKNRVPRFFLDKRENILTGVPQYFMDAHRAMVEKRVSIDPEFTVDIQKTMGGKIDRDENDELRFIDNTTKKSISLALTATGIIQLGMLDILIQSGTIRKNSVLFIDEPEAHLHPEWQDKMFSVLNTLALKGVNVVIATHSPLMLKAIRNIVTKKESDLGYIAVNNFSSPHTSDSPLPPIDDAVNEILLELTKPFYDLYVKIV